MQVLVNSLVAAICAMAYVFTDDRIFVIGFVAALAEAFADTVASGIGVLRGKAFDIFRMKPCTPGLSGGMSVVGTSASLIGALIISLIAFAFGKISIVEIAIITVAAFLGGIFDSLLGSLVQVKYKCSICETITEREEHCGQSTTKYRGIFFVNNDTVNLFGTIFAAALAILVVIIV